MFLNRAANLHRALHRRFRTRVKYQCHPVARRDFKQTARRFRSLKLIGRANNLNQLIDGCVLLINGKLRIADDVDEQNMRDFRFDLFFYFGGHIYFGGLNASFWKRGSFRSGSNIGSSRSSAGVSGTFCVASGPAYDIESSFCKAAMARSGSPIRAATRARISMAPGPDKGSFSIGITAMACSARANAAALSPRPMLISARSPSS